MSGRKARTPQRAPENSQTSISMRSDVLEAARAEARAEGRSLSNWLQRLLLAKFGDPPGKRR